MKTLAICGIPGEGWGWGVCCKNLFRELAKLCDLRILPGNATGMVPWPLFMPLANHDFEPAAPVRGTRNFAYTFFESPLGPNAAANAARYETVFAGSTWCRDKMLDLGITNVKVLLQGVDHEIFRPTNYIEPDRFVIFSGGKFEYRKSQDLVIITFRELLKEFPGMNLKACWWNPWPESRRTMNQSKYIDLAVTGNTQEEYYQNLLRKNGIPYDNFDIMPRLTQRTLADYMRRSTLGLFPNRCEGGTNLVLMEYLACGRPAVTNAWTGHFDLPLDGRLSAPMGTFLENDWFEPDPANLVELTKNLLRDAGLREIMGYQATQSMREWTWARTAQIIIDTIWPESPMSNSPQCEAETVRLHCTEIMPPSQ